MQITTPVMILASKMFPKSETGKAATRPSTITVTTASAVNFSGAHRFHTWGPKISRHIKSPMLRGLLETKFQKLKPRFQLQAF